MNCFNEEKKMFHYYMFNKPVGCVTARSDDRYPTVMDYFKELHNENPDTVHGICFRRNYGKSPALFCGFEAAKGQVVITMLHYHC